MVSKKVGLLAGGILGIVFMVGCGTQSPVDTNTQTTSPQQTPIVQTNQEPTTPVVVEPTSSTTTAKTPTVPTTPKATTFTMADVATHNSESSCYTVVRGEVYNLTSFASQHPGGDRAILSICGKDGTTAFVNQHGGRPRQENMLTGFKIGDLAK